MHLFLTILYAAIFGILIYRLNYFKINGVPRKFLIAVFILKIIFGYILGIVYMYHYEDRKSGDALRFFDDAAVMYRSIDEDPTIYLRIMAGVNVWEEPVRKYYVEMTHMEREFSYGIINDNFTIVKLNAIVMLFSLGHYHVHTVFWCFISFIGLFAMFKTCCRNFPTKTWLLFFSFFLLPSVLFWGSGVLKEGILLLAFGLFFRAFFKIYYKENNRKTWLILLLSLILLIFIKGYLLLAILPAVLSLVFVRMSGARNILHKISGVHIAFFAFILILPKIYPSGDVIEMMKYKQVDFYNVAEESNSGSLLEIPKIESVASIIINSPSALANTYLRPFPWEIKKLLYVGPMIEILILIFCLGIMIWNFKLYKGSGWPILIFALSTVILLGILFGSVVPILGALVRYKMPVLPFLFLLIFINTDINLLQKRFPVLRKYIKRI